MLNIEKAEQVLGWKPTYIANEAIKQTVEWYKHFYEKDVDMFDYTMKQIKDYEDNIKWAK